MWIAPSSLLRNDIFLQRSLLYLFKVKIPYSIFSNLFYRVCFFFIFGFVLLLNASANDMPNDSTINRTFLKNKITLEVKYKSIYDILSTANDNSFKDLSLALMYTDAALEKVQKLNTLDTLFDIYRDIGFIYEDNGLYKEAIFAYEKAYTVALNLPEIKQTDILNDLAIANRKTKNYRSAYNYYDKLLEFGQKHNSKQELAEVYHGLGNLYFDGSVYDKAIENYINSLNYSVMLNDTNDIITSHSDLADSYLKAKYFDKAHIHIEKAFTLASEHNKNQPHIENIETRLARVSTSYGEILVALKDYDNALKKYDIALSIYKGYKQSVGIAHTLLKLVSVYLERKQFDKAEKLFKECETYEAHIKADDQVELHFKLASLYKLQGKIAAAEKEYVKCLELAKKNEFKDLAQQANYQMFLISFNSNNSSDAIKYLTESNSLRDSLFDIDKSRHIAEMELKYDAEKRENEIRSYKLRENRFVLVSGAFVSILVVLFLGLIIQMRGRNYRSLKLKNEEIERQNKKLEESNEILTQFAYVAAHDLKEPLRSIGSYIGLLQLKHAKSLPPEAKEYMVFINGGVKRMYNLLTDLLELSQIISTQAGAEVVRPEDVIEDVKANLRNAIEIKNAVIQYNTDMPSVRMNKLHLMQLFQNLIANALKFSTHQPLITVNGKQDADHILLSVKDNGIGIKKEFAGKIFVLFQQLNKKGLFEGTGIGLTICKNIVEKYNGTIWFESFEGEGTTFFISIPT